MPKASGQNSAPSSHMVFDDNFDGDIIINEVRVPPDGEAMYTYYEALGWRGKGAGYAGIQVHPKAHLFIFSIWDHKEHTAPIRSVYRGPGTQTVRFGGEGTGLKSWNFELGWSTGVWYTLVTRTWPVEDHTYYGFWVRAGDSGLWTHLVTMDVAAEALFQGGTDAFIEDWDNSGVHSRATNLRGGWKRKTDGTWFPFGAARYSVNAWDLAPGKRSYNFRTNWDGGVGRDDTDPFYYMISGGADTRPTATNPARFAIERRDTEPAYKKIEICELKAAWQAGNRLQVEWTTSDTAAPQFAYTIRVFDNPEAQGAPLATSSAQVPHARSATLNLTPRDSHGRRYFLQLQCTDILDRRSKPVVTPVAGSAQSEK